MRMRYLAFIMAFVTSSVVAQPALALPISLQRLLVNANGTLYTNLSLVPGVNTVAWDATTGLGTLVFEFNPGAAGAYFFDVFFDHQLGTPAYNEYGTVNGAPSAGQTYQIGDSFTSTIYANTAAGGSLPNTNTLPGTSSNFTNLCVGATCNGDFAAALGFSFILGAAEKGVLTFAVSTTNPGGFRLQDTHPVDADNPTAAQFFIGGSLGIVPSDTSSPNAVPEPSTLVLLGIGLFAAGRWAGRKKRSARLSV